MIELGPRRCSRCPARSLGCRQVPAVVPPELVRARITVIDRTIDDSGAKQVPLRKCPSYRILGVGVRAGAVVNRPRLRAAVLEPDPLIKCIVCVGCDDRSALGHLGQTVSVIIRKTTVLKMSHPVSRVRGPLQ